MRVVKWTKDIAKRELSQRLKAAAEARRDREREWEVAEKAVFVVSGVNDDTGPRVAMASDLQTAEVTGTRSKVSVNKIFKNYRFLHSQLSANPPTVICRPTSADQEDRRKADAADRLVRHGIRKYELQEFMDLCSAQTLLYGTGFVKTRHNPEAGDLLEFNRETGEVLMEGDIDVSVPSVWNIFLDPDADVWKDVRYVFERLYVPYEEACSRWPEHKDLFDKIRKKEVDVAQGVNADSERSPIRQTKYDVLEIYEYWETGLPVNGMQGRFCYCLPDGTVIGEIAESPHRFSVEKDENGNIVPDSDLQQAELPYDIFTDIDNTVGGVWGKATTIYEVPLQEIHNSVLNATIDSVRAHGVGRLILPEGCELADDSLTDSPLDIIRITGREKPQYTPPMQLPAAMSELIAITAQGVDDMAGVNESMFGQQSREQSGFSMQYATNQGNMIRRRLFNKYVKLVEGVFRTYLSLVRKHWTMGRTVLVLGREKAFEAKDIQGADITGGFDLVVEYGASLSLDPTSRRQEIMTLMPVFEKAGVPTNTILEMLKLNELENLYDLPALARERQSEIFTRIVETGKQIEPEELQDHQKMLAYAYTYLMSAEFRDLNEPYKSLIKEHVKLREALAAQGPQPGQPQGAPAPGGAGGAAGGSLPVAAGMTDQQAQVTQVPQMVNG